LLDSVFAILEQERVIADLIPEPKPWILCIDDDCAFLESLRHRLEALGVGVFNAFDGIGGFQTAFSQRANAIILDYNMPNGQGDYVLQRLKETEITRDIPVIVLTGNKDDAVRRKMLGLGADAFLSKPPILDQLFFELKKHVVVPNENFGL
jgi:CheY-like chemotaxis protein